MFLPLLLHSLISLSRIARISCVMVLIGLIPFTLRAAPPLRGTAAGQLVSGPNHTLLLRANGALYAWGNNASGQLGDGSLTSHSNPVLVNLPGNTGATRLLQVAVGSAHSLAVALNGQLYAWGNNSTGQLGDGTTVNRTTPVAVTTPTTVRFTQVAASGTYSLALTNEGQLYAWGSNGSGQLGDGTLVAHNTPTAVSLPAGVRIKQVAASTSQVLALTDSGLLYAWGDNSYGQLGDGTTSNRLTPVLVSNVTLPAGICYTQVDAGITHSVALTADGKLFAWGRNNVGQLGDSTTIDRLLPTAVRIRSTSVPVGTRFVHVLSGTAHSLALAADGKLYAWGDNAAGQLGDGSAAAHATRVPVGLPAAVYITQAAVGTDHNLALTADGTLYGWGDNASGQLGDGTTLAHPTPQALATPLIYNGYTQGAVGSGHSLALRGDGLLVAFGSNGNGQLGDGTLSLTPKPLPVPVDRSMLTPGTRFTQVVAGAAYSLALASDGLAYGWGGNTYGSLGTVPGANNTIPTAVRMVSLPTGTRFTQLAASGYRTIALTAEGTLYQWGFQGVVYPTAVSLSGLPVGTRFVQIAAGLDHFLALAANGTLYTWGDNTYGQLGDGTILFRATPVAVYTGNLPAGTRFSQVAAGGYHCLALATNGSLYAWGFNGYGGLGTASLSSLYTPGLVQAGGLAAGTHFTALAAGGYHSLALANGRLYAWGRNDTGQRGDNTFTQATTPVQESSQSTNWIVLGAGANANHSLAIGGADAVYTAGNNYFGQLGDGTMINSPVFLRNQAVLPTRPAVTGSAELAVYPIPAHGTLYIQEATPSSTLTLSDILGHLVASITTTGAGSAALTLPATLTAGVYILRNGRLVKRIVVE